MSLINFTLLEAKKALNDKKFSSLELTQAFLEQIEKKKELNSFITVTSDLALEQARQADKNYANGTPGLLEGIPLVIKDLFCTKGIRTTAGSKILNDFIPPYESTVTQNLFDAGALMVGKANMDEFAMGSSNLTSAYGPVINPYRSTRNPEKKLVPGGSSGGSAAAIAARLALGATGSDTGGSIRQPASFCGLVGIKPTYGLCSRYGMIAFASSLDQAGPIAHTVADSAILLEVMVGYDVKDATSINIDIPSYHKLINRNIKGMRIGIAEEYMQDLNEDTKKVVEKGIEWLSQNGCEIINISLKTTPYALPTYYIIAPAEASSNLARYDGVRYGMRVDGKNIDEMYSNTRHDGFGQEVKRRIMIGTYVLSAGYYDAYYNKAKKIKRLIVEDFNQAFQKVDLILTPTTVGPAFGFEDKVSDPISMYLNDIFTVTVNLAGLPAISIPAGLTDDGLPLGLQLIGPKFSEQTIFNVGQVIEDSAGFLRK